MEDVYGQLGIPSTLLGSHFGIPGYPFGNPQGSLGTFLGIRAVRDP